MNIESVRKQGKEYLYFKSGKPKKSYCACLTWYPKELARLYHRTIIQCAGSRCPFYSVGCGRSELKEWEEQKQSNE